jgi:DNA-binding response OmpR family regulator
MSDTRRSVIIMEDDEDIAALFCQLLQSHGVEPILCRNEAGVLAAAGSGTVVLALLDIMVPDTDGRDVAARLRASKVSFPIYYMTGMRETAIGEAHLAQADGILRKPFSISDLRGILDGALSRAAAEKQDPARQLLELMTSLATEQEGLRRQQAQLLGLLRGLEQEIGPRSRPIADGFREFTMGIEASLGRFAGRLAEIQKLLGRK